MMRQLRLSSFLPSLFGLILSFIVITQSIPDNKYLYEHQKALNNGNHLYISESIHLLPSKSRLRRDATDSESKVSQTESQDATEVSKPTVNTDAAASIPSKDQHETVGSPKGQKTQKIETVTFSDHLHDNDTLWETVDQADTVINKTFDENIDKKANQTWKLEEERGLNHKEAEAKEDHKYYIAEVIKSEHQPYIDLDEWNKTKPHIVSEHPMLSKSYRRAATIPLQFSFPFYGHNVKNITIATGGFLYTGDYVHSWLAATQYIAPLMANFDTSSSQDSKIRYADNGTALVVEWLNVTLQSRNGGPILNGNSLKSDSSKIDETFRFQAILHKTGDIVFAYKNIPRSIVKMDDNEHPVKVGLSDAYIIDRTIFFVRRKTIYEYHRINQMDKEITSGTAIWFRAQPTCNVHKSCNQCVSYKCNWCPKVDRCSDGMDRLRQNWLMARCDEHNAKTLDQCTNIGQDKGSLGNFKKIGNRNNLGTNGYSGTVGTHDWGIDSTSEVGKEKLSAKGNYQHATITTISIVALLAISVMVWFVYAYFFPHTWSGQLLIKYRPSRWQWRRGEPRYTAASIHM